MKAHRHTLLHHYRLLLGVLCLILVGALLALTVQQSLANPEPVRVIIDTDMGVDDAAAVAWMLSQPKFPVEVVGITTVGGNTTTENVANNVLTILEAAGRTDIPVIIGAGSPLSQTLSATGAFVHGPDGLWFIGWANPHDLSGLPTDAPGFLCSHAAADVKLVALGPLTNVAQAVALCPDQMALYQDIIILGAAKGGGNITPLAEFNFWIDPEAANRVLTANLMPTIIPLETFTSFTLTQEDIDELAADGKPVGQLLAGALQTYYDVQTMTAGRDKASVPDVTAVMLALGGQTFVKEEQTALVKMVPGIVGEPDPERLGRGQSIMGLTVPEKIPMIANDVELSDLAQRAFTEPGFNLEMELGLILQRAPDNATVILDIRERSMHRLFMRFLTN